MVPAPRRLLLSALGATLVLAVSGVGALPPATPTAPVPNRVEGIAQELRSFANTGSVLHVGAHPDDENTELITWLSRGRGYRTAYLSLTRGDGGQNELGPEFDEKLGVLRTQELLAARRLDGGRQFFTRAIDFGYSKTPEETLRFWDRDQVLADVVRIYRQFRPDVVVTRFPIPPGSGGHGHHTASAILAVEAFKLAGDPQAFPGQLAEGLAPWQPRRVLWNSWPGRDGGLSGPSFILDIAGTDPVTGEAFGLIAARSRAMHKTQGLAGFINRARTGANEQNFMLLAGDPATSDLLDGIDTTWARVPGGAEIAALATTALAQFNAEDPAAALPALLALHRKLTALLSGEPGQTTFDPLLADKRTQLDRIIQACLGLEVESTVDRAEVVPGEMIRVTTTTRVAQAVGKPLAHVNPSGGLTALKPGQPDTHTVERATPAGLPLTQPYWLREESLAGLARVSDPRLIGLPESPPTLSLRHEFAINDVHIFITDEPVHLTHGEKGEVRHRLNVIAPVALALDSDIYLVAPGAVKDITVEVTAARAGSTGTLQLEAPVGWQVAPTAQDFHLAKVGGQARFAFQVTAPNQPAPGHLTAVAKVAGQRYSNQRIELRYDHLPVQLLQPPARARLASFDFGLRGRIVGYLPGAGDAVAGCLEQMGCTVRLLSGADLTPEKLADLDTVVLGVRAFNERSDLKDNFPGLLAWVEAGGTVVAQYNRPNRLLAPELGPYALSIQGPAPALRVTDETAPVALLALDHPALTTPNKITAADFEGWVQERGAYFPSSWDQAHYTALLAMNDPGEAPLQGSVLIARYGRGHYVYNGLAFFRQLPAGVPGAYRLFANLLSLGQ